MTIVKAKRCRKLRVRKGSQSLIKGGPGSGNFGHAGRPGEVGGSAPDGIDNVSGDSKQTVRSDRAIDKIIAFLRTGISQGDVFPFSNDPDLEGLRKALRQSMDWSVIQSRYEVGDYRGVSYEKEIQRFFSLDSGVSMEELLQFKNVPPNLLLEYAATQEEVPRKVWDRALSHLQGSSSPLSDAAAVLSSSEAFGRIPKDWVEKLMTPYELAHVALWNSENSENVNEEKIVAILRDYKVGYASAYYQIAASRIGDLSAENLMGFDNWAKLDGAGLSAHIASYPKTTITAKEDYHQLLFKWVDEEKTDANGMISAILQRPINTAYIRELATAETWRKVFDNTKMTPEIAQRFERDLGVSPNDMQKEFRDRITPYLSYTDADGKKIDYPEGTSSLIGEFRKSYLDGGGDPLGILSGTTGTLIEKAEVDDIAASTMKRAISEQMGGYVRDNYWEKDKEISVPGMATYKASDFLRQWAQSSNDTDMRSLGVQEQAAVELGADLTPWQKTQIEVVKAGSSSSAPADFAEDDYDPMQRYLFQGANRDEESAKGLIRAHLRANYEMTQAKLTDLGVDQVLVYRGVILKPDKQINRDMVGKEIEVQENALSSWSTSLEIAKEFAGSGYAERGKLSVVLSMVVPAKDVYSTSVSGQGSLLEEEVIVLSHKKPRIAKIVSISGVS